MESMKQVSQELSFLRWGLVEVCYCGFTQTSNVEAVLKPLYKDNLHLSAERLVRLLFSMCCHSKVRSGMGELWFHSQHLELKVSQFRVDVGEAPINNVQRHKWIESRRNKTVTLMRCLFGVLQKIVEKHIHHTLKEKSFAQHCSRLLAALALDIADNSRVSSDQWKEYIEFRPKFLKTG